MYRILPITSACRFLLIYKHVILNVSALAHIGNVHYPELIRHIIIN